MRTGTFIENVLDDYRDHVSSFWSPEDVDLIESEHAELLEKFSDDVGLRDALARCDNTTSFDDAWDKVKGCDYLRGFCGGLATAFANTTSVESDFSILKWEVDEVTNASVLHKTPIEPV